MSNLSLELHSADFANLGHCADFSLVLRPKFAKNHESQTENPSVVDSAHNAQNLGKNQAENAESNADSANPQNLTRKTTLFKSFCYFLLLQKVEFPTTSSLRDSALCAESWQSTFKNAESTRFAESANKTQQTIEGIAVEVVEFLEDFGCKAGLESAQCPKSSKSTQDAPKNKLQQDTSTKGSSA